MAPFTKANLFKCPEIGDEIKSWKEVILLAHYVDYRVGMCPANYNLDNDKRFPPFDDDDDDDDDGDGLRFSWFLQPASPLIERKFYVHRSQFQKHYLQLMTVILMRIT